MDSGSENLSSISFRLTVSLSMLSSSLGSAHNEIPVIGFVLVLKHVKTQPY